MGEVHRDLRFGLQQRVQLLGEDDIDVGAADQHPDGFADPRTVDGGHQTQVGRGRDRIADHPAHAPGCANDADADHRRTLPDGRGISPPGALRTVERRRLERTQDRKRHRL